MPDTTTTSAPTADAESAVQIADGVTPPNAVATASASAQERVTYEKALAELNKLNRREGGNHLLDREEVDPVTKLENRDPLSGWDNPTEEEAEVEAPTAEEEETPEAATEEEIPTAEAEESDDEEAEEPQPATKRKRLNINRQKDGQFVHDARERAVLQLVHDEGVSLAEAERRLFGERQPAAQEPAAKAAESDAPPEKTPAEIDAEIARLKEARKAARVKYDENGANEATEQIEDLLKLRSDAVQRDVERRQSQTQAQGQHEQQVQQSFKRAAGVYTDASVVGSPLNLALEAETERLFSIKSPLLNDPEWPETVAAKVANKLGILPTIASAAKAAAAPKVITKAAAPVKRATPAPSPGTVSSASAPINKTAVLRERLQAANAKGDWKAMQELAAEIHAPSAA